MQFEPVIGLEVHAELQTQSKMFCSCEVVDNTLAAPNTSACPVCSGMPGTLPVVNEKAVDFAIRVALALQCEVQRISIFARKNYSILTCLRAIRSHNMRARSQSTAG